MSHPRAEIAGGLRLKCPGAEIEFAKIFRRARRRETEDVAIGDAGAAAEQRLHEVAMEGRGRLVADTRREAGFHGAWLPVLCEDPKSLGHVRMKHRRELRSYLPLFMEQPFQQDFVHPAAETLLSIDHHDRHACVIFRPQLGVGIDVDSLGSKPITCQESFGFFAKMATGPSEKENLGRHRGESEKVSGTVVAGQIPEQGYSPQSIQTTAWSGWRWQKRLNPWGGVFESPQVMLKYLETCFTPAIGGCNLFSSKSGFNFGVRHSHLPGASAQAGRRSTIENA